MSFPGGNPVWGRCPPDVVTAACWWGLRDWGRNAKPPTAGYVHLADFLEVMF
jgi:hypothetical protein